MLSHRVFAYYGLMSPSRYLPRLIYFVQAVFVLRSDRDGHREVPQFTPRVSPSVPSSVPRQSNGAYRLFLLHPLWPSPSLQRLGICHLPAGSLWVVCVFGAATFALCYGPVGCLLFTGKSFYFRAFASRGRPRGASSITIRPNSQLPEPDFHRQDTQHYGLRAENVEKRKYRIRESGFIFQELFSCFLNPIRSSAFSASLAFGSPFMSARIGPGVHFHRTAHGVAFHPSAEAHLHLLAPGPVSQYETNLGSD